MSKETKAKGTSGCSVARACDRRARSGEDEPQVSASSSWRKSPGPIGSSVSGPAAVVGAGSRRKGSSAALVAGGCTKEAQTYEGQVVRWPWRAWAAAIEADSVPVAVEGDGTSSRLVCAPGLPAVERQRGQEPGSSVC